MTIEIEKKKREIRKFEEKIGNKKFLVFCPPKEDILYKDDELKAILKHLNGVTIPSGLSTVEKSQWVKYEVIKLLGYKKPDGLRTNQARNWKPKFINQLLDIFVQSSCNLQIWNYIPYDDNIIEGSWNKNNIRFSDCRYVIIMHDEKGVIYKISLKRGFELSKWDSTGTKTIKWQGNIPLALRANITLMYDDYDPLFQKIMEADHKVKRKIISIENFNSNLEESLVETNSDVDYALQKGISPNDVSFKQCTRVYTLDEKWDLIQKIDSKSANPLIKLKPDPETLYTNHEISELIKPLKLMEIDYPGSGQERVIGQLLEKKIAESLGYNYFTQTDSGDFPDLLHQLIEIKFQYSGTIDLGRNLPTDPKPIDSTWNEWGISNKEIRYCIFLMDLVGDKYIVQNIVLVSGENFSRYFNICSGTSFKVQLQMKIQEL